MNILITGNMGYIGPTVARQLRATYPAATLSGLDQGYFAHSLTNATLLPECRLDRQYFADVRRVTDQLLENVDAIVHLAAISNDPMGNAFEEVTLDINYRATVALAERAKKRGVKTFVFASSCSMYGFAADGERTETSPLNPLTAYAKSKVASEEGLAKLADRGFKVTSLRFATACGMSERLRLDLVVNDFVASAVAQNKITILSDGTPWRPLIHIRDMARAIDWAIGRDPQSGAFLALNAGSNQWNFQVRELAEIVAKVMPGVEISINKNAAPDKRSYRVNFDLFKSLAPAHQPVETMENTIRELKDGLEAMRFRDGDFRNSQFMRLKVLEHLRSAGLLSADLSWNFR